MQNWQLEKEIKRNKIKIMTCFITRCRVLAWFKYGREPAIRNYIFIQTKKWKFCMLSHWLSFHDIYYKLYVKLWQERKKSNDFTPHRVNTNYKSAHEPLHIIRWHGNIKKVNE